MNIKVYTSHHPAEVVTTMIVQLRHGRLKQQMGKGKSVPIMHARMRHTWQLHDFYLSGLRFILDTSMSYNEYQACGDGATRAHPI